MSRVSRWLLLLVEKSLLLLCFIGRTRQMMALDPEGKKSLTLEFEFFTFVISTFHLPVIQNMPDSVEAIVQMLLSDKLC